MKFLNFFLLLWVIFAPLDPDLDSEYGSGSIDLIESGSNPDPDPKPCKLRVTSGTFELGRTSAPGPDFGDAFLLLLRAAAVAAAASSLSRTCGQLKRRSSRFSDQHEMFPNTAQC
jgi:hypothetical protein